MEKYEIKLSADEFVLLNQLTERISQGSNEVDKVIADYLYEIAAESRNLDDRAKKSCQAIRRTAIERISNYLKHPVEPNEIILRLKNACPEVEESLVSIIKKDILEISK